MKSSEFSTGFEPVVNITTSHRENSGTQKELRRFLFEKLLTTTLASLVLACSGPEKMTSPIPVDDMPPVEKSYPVDIPEMDTVFPQRPGYPTAHGYPSGTIIIDGGGNYGFNGAQYFRDAIDSNLESWADLPVIVVPTALPDCPVPPGNACVDDGDLDYQLRQVYLRNITIVHTRTPTIADTEEFVEPLKTARGVWFTGGRQWRLADAYLGTRFMDELKGVLDRGGVVGGTSAGASIMGSFLIRGDTNTNLIVIGDHVEGFGFLQNIGVDQHVAERGREEGLFELVNNYQDHLGIGLDEPITGVLRGNIMEVKGNSGHAYIHYYDLSKEGNYLLLPPGTVYDIFTLRTR